jgi:dihydroneopterin aldolase
MSANDVIFVRGLAIHAYHGVMPHEAKVGQVFKLTLQMHVDLDRASRSDKLADTINYGDVVAITTEAFCAKRYRLIEAAAGAVIEALLAKYPRAATVSVTVHKPHAPIPATFEDAGVTITRSRGG